MYNEEYIIPYWLRHYEKFANRIFVGDDRSTDNTRKLLQQHPKVTLLDLGPNCHDDAYWVVNFFPLYEKYSKGKADWVIVADADEFVYHPQILDVLQEQKDYGINVIRCEGYEMISDKLPTTKGQIYEEIKMGVPNALESKWTVHSANVSLRFRKGRHGPVFNQRNFRLNRKTGIRLLHFRHLTFDYYSERDRIINKRDLTFASEDNRHPWTLQKEKTMPDHSIAIPKEWFSKHKSEAVNVVDF